MRLALPIALLSLLALSPLACDSAGGDGGGEIPGTTTTPGAQRSAFDDLFGGGGAQRAGDQAASESCAAGDAGCQDPQGPDEPNPNPIDPVDLGLPECSAPLPLPPTAPSVCTPLCDKIAECRGDTSLLTACVADCADSLRGMEMDAVSAIFDCFVDASCDAVNAWAAGGGAGGEDTIEPTPEPAPRPEPGADAQPARREGAEDGGGEAPPEGVDGDDGTANPIGECVRGIFMGGMDQPLSAAKQAVCEDLTQHADECDGGEVQVSGGGSAGSASGSVPASEADPQDPSGADDGGSDPAPPREQQPRDHAEDMDQCVALASLLSAPVLDRVAACFTETDCDAREDCLEGVLACVPFLPTVLFGAAEVSGSGPGEPTVPADPVEPSEPSDSGS